jgi:hypothetical protein
MTIPDNEYGTPDDESPEWSEEDFLWAVRAADFGGDPLQVVGFLKSREAFLRNVMAAGLPRSAFLSFAPQKPGFIDRATRALELSVAAARNFMAEDSTKHAAE